METKTSTRLGAQRDCRGLHQGGREGRKERGKEGRKEKRKEERKERARREEGEMSAIMQLGKFFFL